MERNLEQELELIDEKIESLKERIKNRKELLETYERERKNIQYEINRNKFKNEYQYNTIEAINELMKDDTKVFQNSCPTPSGLLYLIKTGDGVMIFSEDTKKPHTLMLSHWNIDIAWKEVFEVSDGVYE